MIKLNKKLIILLQYFVIILIFYFLFNIVYKNWNQIKNYDFHFQIKYLIVSFIIFFIFYFILNLNWHLIVVKLGISVSFRKNLTIWSYSQLGKYMPGKIWLYFGRIYYYQKQYIAKRVIGIALILEMFFSMLSSGLIFLFFLVNILKFTFKNYFLLIFLISIITTGLIILHPKIFNKIINLILRLVKRPLIKFKLFYRDIIILLLLYVVNFFIQSIGLYFFINSITYIPFNQILYLAGTLAGAYIIGTIAVFSPAGLGFREGVLVFYLGRILTKSIAVIISVAARLWWIVGELFCIFLVFLIDKYIFRKEITYE